MPSPNRVLVTLGEPAGIGPDVFLQLAHLSFPVELVVIGDPNLLIERALQLGISIDLIETNIHHTPSLSTSGAIKFIPVPLNAPVIPGQLNADNAAYVIRTLEMATDFCLQGNAQALVTGPVHKAILNTGGIAFSGHTEFFAKRAKTSHTVMLFVIDHLKVALATTHIPLANVPAAITKDRLKTIISILNKGLQEQFHIASPRIFVCGLNPHAGEGGYLGREEIEVITPTLDELRNLGYLLSGPLPADTIFTKKHLENADAIVGMYHDQVLPVIKTIAFDKAVNVTLGLPFIRTSVDHGTALNLAGTGEANPGSMLAAINLAIEMSTSSSKQP